MLNEKERAIVGALVACEIMDIPEEKEEILTDYYVSLRVIESKLEGMIKIEEYV